MSVVEGAHADLGEAQACAATCHNVSVSWLSTGPKKRSTIGIRAVAGALHACCMMRVVVTTLP